MHKEIKASFDRLLAYCEEVEYKGYDPYDGLNSRLFRALPLVSRSRYARLAWIQLFKRSPLNLRALTGVRKEYNPKALGLFLAGYCNLYSVEPSDHYRQKMEFFVKEILEARTPGWSGDCWGYNFDWQARAFFQPKFTPTVVASTFVANGLLDAYEITKDEKLLKSARSTCDFILKDLNRTYDENGNFAFSYSPEDKSVVYNASLLGSRLLARVGYFTKENLLCEEARKSVLLCCDHQREDGSWGYGTLPFHQWVDNFHTGYNLECISDYMKFANDYSFKSNVDAGFEYYIKTFFTADGVPKYYNNSTFPIDVHAPAQFIITLGHLGKFDEQKQLAATVMNWTIKHMQSPKGYFYYQINKYFSSRIPYIRWAQAWMFYALSTYLKLDKNEQS